MTTPPPPDDDYTPTDDHDPRAPPPKTPHPLAPALRAITGTDDIDPAWTRALARSGKGAPTKEPGNAALILARTAAWRGVLRHDAFADRVIVGTMPPLPHLPDGWESLEPPEAGDLTQHHDLYAGMWLARMWHVSWPPGAVRAGLVYAAHQHSFHPLRDYLTACAATWDRTNRVDTWLCDHLGVQRSVYAYRIASMYLISAVARAFDPGCKVDHVLVLEGEQGKGKSTALEILFGADWFLPDLPDLRDKESMHALAGCWCALADELSAIRGAVSIERAKSFFTRRIDVYRPPYRPDFVRRPRTTVFAATTNAPEYLTDETGNRRYWPALCQGDLDFDGLREARDQLWGEAVHRYREGEQWHPEASLLPALRAAQDDRVISDEWEPRIRNYITGRPWVTIAECLRELMPGELEDRPDHQRRVGRCLTRMGWELHRPRVTSADGSTHRERRYYSAGTWTGDDDD